MKGCETKGSVCSRKRVALGRQGFLTCVVGLICAASQEERTSSAAGQDKYLPSLPDIQEHQNLRNQDNCVQTGKRVKVGRFGWCGLLSSFVSKVHGKTRCFVSGCTQGADVRPGFVAIYQACKCVEVYETSTRVC